MRPLTAVLFAFAAAQPAAAQSPSDDQIRRELVVASREAYLASRGPCPCPDNRMRNGRRCGGFSAYSKPGGAAPLCYPSDVTDAMVQRYRARLSRSAPAS